MPPFNWNDLRYFLAVARTGNPTRAAKQLTVDHTTVRRRILALEESLHARLFEPRDRGFVLTPAGERLVRLAESVESLAMNAEEDISGQDKELSGSVRIGAPDGLGSLFLAPHLADFATKHPELEIELVAMSRLFNLSKREADIAITMLPPTQGRQVIRKLTDCRLYLYASEEYLARSPEIRSVDDLQDHRFIGYFEDMLFAQNLNYVLPNTTSNPYRFLSTNLVAQYQATLAGGGICLLPRYMTEGVPTIRRVLPDEVKVDREIWITIHSDLKDLARYRTVADFIYRLVAHYRHLFTE